MGLPSKKRPKSEKRKRRNAHRLKPASYINCASCGRPRRKHHACSFCGIYKGKEFKKQKKETLKQEVKK